MQIYLKDSNSLPIDLTKKWSQLQVNQYLNSQTYRFDQKLQNNFETRWKRMSFENDSKNLKRLDENQLEWLNMTLSSIAENLILPSEQRNSIDRPFDKFD